MGQKKKRNERNAINGAVESAKNDQTVLSTMYSFLYSKNA